MTSRTTGTSKLAFEAREPGRFRLAGVLAADTARKALRDGNRAFDELTAIGVDLSGVTRADSAGLAVLVAWAGRVRGRGGTLTYSAVPVGLLAIARLCGVDSMLRLTP